MGIWKRFICGVMAMIMVISLLPVSALAAEIPEEPEGLSEEAEPMEVQDCADDSHVWDEGAGSETVITYTCTVCGATREEELEVQIPPDEVLPCADEAHIWGEGVLSDAAGDTPAVMTYICTVCMAKREEIQELPTAASDTISEGDDVFDIEGGFCGENVMWELTKSTGSLRIYGEGEMFNYSRSDSAPWKQVAGTQYPIQSVCVEDGVTSIGNRAFDYCTQLVNLEISTSVTRIGSFAFSDCDSLVNVTIPDSVTVIEDDAFNYCVSLTEILIPGSVKNIGNYAFSNCSRLADITIEEGVIEIGGRAFAYLDSLNDVAIPDSVAVIGDSAFIGCRNLSKITIGKGNTQIASSAFKECYRLTEFVVSFGNPYYCTDSQGILYDKDMTTLLQCHVPFSGVLTIPESVTRIAPGAFRECEGLTDVVSTANIAEIGNHAFYGCKNLHSVDIPNSMPSIGQSAFSGCSGLSSFISDGITDVGDYAFNNCDWLQGEIEIKNATTIGEHAFWGCSKIENIILSVGISEIKGGAFADCTKLQSIVIPEGVTRIGEGAFIWCELDSITIPKTVKVIGQSAFLFSGLKDVFYSGAESDRANIKIYSDNPALSDATWHYNSTGPEDSSDGGTVGYFTRWDAENQIATIDNLLRCQVTERTDMAFLDQLDALVGNYVLVETEPYEANPEGLLNLVSVKPVESRVGIITDINGTTVKIDGSAYTIPADFMQSGAAVTSKVLYHTFGGELQKVELLTDAKGTLKNWNAETRELIINIGGEDQLFTLSHLVENGTEFFLGATGEKNYSVEYLADEKNNVFEIQKIGNASIPVEPEGLPHDEWINRHIDYAKSTKYSEQVVKGFPGTLNDAIEEIKEDGSITAYKTLDSINSILGYDLDLSDTQEYELLLAQILFARNGVTSIEDMYDKYISDRAVRGIEVMLKFIEDATDWESEKLEKCYKQLETIKGIATGTTEFKSALNGMLTTIGDYSNFEFSESFSSACDNAGLKFAASLTKDQFETFCNTADRFVMYVAAGEAYLDTSEAFGEMILEMRKHIGVPSDDSRFDFYPVEGAYVTDETIWDILNIQRQNPYLPPNPLNTPVVLPELAAAIENYYLSLESYKIDGAKTIAGNAVVEYVEGTCDDWMDNGLDTAISLFEHLPVIKEFSQLKKLFKNAQVAVDKFTVIDDRAFQGTMVMRLYCMAYIHYITVDNMARYVDNWGMTISNDLADGSTMIFSESEQFKKAVEFDEAIAVYRAILSVAAQYAKEYYALYYNEIDKWLGSYPSYLPKFNKKIIELEEQQNIDLSYEWCHSTRNIYIQNNGITVYETPNLSIYSFKCPVEITIKDESGKVIASLSDNNSVIASGYEHYFFVTETVYGEGDYLKIATIPQSYNVTIEGTGAGALDAIYSDFENDQLAYTKYYLDVPVTENSSGAFSYDDSSQKVLLFDNQMYVGNSDGHMSHATGEEWHSDDVQHWHKCTDCEQQLDIASHSGGTASCTEKAVCSTCGASYGSLAPHLFENGKCSICGAAQGGEPPEGEDFTLTLDNIGDADTVWVDGQAYPVQKNPDGGSYVALSSGEAKTAVVYSYNAVGEEAHKTYPTGMKVWTLDYQDGCYTATYVPEFENLLQYKGSSIRITGNKGIRMITGVPEDKRDQLIQGKLAGYTLEEYGTVLAIADQIENDSLTLGDTYAKSNYAYKRNTADAIFAHSGGLIQYTNVLVGFTMDQCDDDIAMRPYMKLSDKDGNEITLYGGVVYRSIGYIAWQNKDIFPKGSDGYNYIWDIINAVYGDNLPG